MYVKERAVFSSLFAGNAREYIYMYVGEKEKRLTFCCC